MVAEITPIEPVRVMPEREMRTYHDHRVRQVLRNVARSRLRVPFMGFLRTSCPAPQQLDYFKV